ncbi:MAG: TetR/AcrR family transcriptional regulator [Pseudomonadota bacterium]
MPIGGARRAEAVEIAKEIFWKSGYADASIAEIVEATGLNRYALYSEFGGKRELFLEALDSYYNQCGEKYHAAVQDPKLKPLERIQIVLQMMAEDVGAQERGCLMCQIAVEVAREDEGIGTAVGSYFEQIRDALEAPLAEAAAAGELNPNLSPKDAATVVFDAKMSLGVHARSGADPEQWRRIVAATMAAISAPPLAPSTT